MTTNFHVKKKNPKKIKTTGQLSIFAALIFQTLFVLFAMSLNIALVVHDKINLQNSVDLAAYYGAMKQAEVLNAIAHVNYQIRQSWKLLVWRYRILGSYGTVAKVFTLPSGREPQNKDEDFSPISFHPRLNRMGVNSFCVGHSKWGLLMGNQIPPIREDNFCYNMETSIQLMRANLSIPGIATGFVGGLSNLNARLQASNQSIAGDCNAYGYNSWLLAFLSTAFFLKDQTSRKQTIYKLATLLKNGRDINDELISEGVKKTFKYNLTYINHKSYEAHPNLFRHFNSLENENPSAWLMDHPFNTTPFYSQITGHSNNGSNGSCPKKLELLIHPHPQVCSGGDINRCSSQPEVTSITKRLFQQTRQSLCQSEQFCDTSAGLTKNPRFLIYFNTYAEIKYENQIFLPRGQNITLKARSYAKPFGGRIGPPNSADERLPDPPFSIRNFADFERFDKTVAPNYSRYPKDPHGLRSHASQLMWAKYLSSTHASSTPKDNKNMFYYAMNRRLDDEDILARDDFRGGGINILARKWELAAIAPDLFDVTYFTILPFYMDTYFPKIKAIGFNPRGDLGYYETVHGRSNNHDSYNIKYQIENVWNEIASPSQRPFYKITKLEHILTGWNPPTKKYTNFIQGYSPDSLSRFPFGTCHPIGNQWGTDLKKRIGIGCVYGGRTGYSVKIMSACGLESTNAVNLSALQTIPGHPECSGSSSP